MSALLGKHQFGELAEKRVTIVEKGITKERADFLQNLLQHNNFEVVRTEDASKTEGEPSTYSIGVTDMVFNPTIWIFQRRLLTPDGRKVTQDYWNQLTIETPPQYFASKL